jgi:hypothetical protein
MPLDWWRMIAMDSAPLNGQTTMSFFNDPEDSGGADSIKTIENEQKVVDLLFNNQMLRDFVVEEFISQTGNYHLVTEVGWPLISDPNEKPGDIDVLIIPKDNESETIAIEVKYFKSETRLNKESFVNKADKIFKASKQVNSYLKFGFHKVFFVVVLIDDARNEDTPNTILRRTKNDKIDQVFWHNDYSDVSDEIGIVFIGLTQTMNKSYNLSISAKIKTKRVCKSRGQSLGTTDKIKKLLQK